MSPAVKRYGPFGLLVVVQLLVVLLAPSLPARPRGGDNGSFSASDGSANGFGGSGSGSGSAANGGTGGGATGSSGSGAGGVGGTSGGGAGGTGSGASGGSGSGGGATGSNAGTFCVTGLLEHAPCLPKWTGGNNGGATSMGVTATTVKVVMYRNADNQAVDAILRSTGTYISPQAEQAMLGAATAWVNAHLQLYGRKLDVQYVQGTCDPSPPKDDCFRADADNVVSTYHPFAVFWDNDTNESAFFDELSRKGVVNWGGWGFTDSFNNGLRPYHYDALMGGLTQAQITGQWYCRRLANQTSTFAGTGSNGKKRLAAVVYPDTAQTTPSAKALEAIIKGCDSNGVVDSPYSSDISSAATQATSTATKLSKAGVTTVIWFSDVIAPAYATKAFTTQNYYPENMIAGSGLLDYDALAQTYDQSQWVHAFGPSDLAFTPPLAQTDAGRIWTAQGNSGTPDPSANLLTSYLLSVATGISAAGPNLSPRSYEYGLLTGPGYDSWAQWHDPRLLYVKFGANDYTAQSDIREVYWSTTATSPINGKPGAYIALNGGQRYQLGQIPSGQPALPAGV